MVKIIRKPTELVGQLRVKVLHPGDCEWRDYGLVSEALVTNAAIAQLVGILLGDAGGAFSAVAKSWKYHATGTGSTAEAYTDTALVAEVGTRVVGSQASTGPGNYRTVAVVTYTAPLTIREHGVFSAASGPTCLDRSVIAPVPVINGTQVQYDYQLVFAGL